MSYRSWLKDVKHMRDLGSHVYSVDDDWETQEKRDQVYYALSKNPPEGTEDFSHQFYRALYDTRILRLNRNDREFSIQLEDFLAGHFVEVIAGYVGVTAPEIECTITLQFHDVAYQTTLAARPDGVLRFFRFEGPSQTDYLYRNWFVRQDSRLQWIAELCVFRRNMGLLTLGPYLAVDCGSVSVIDERESVLKRTVSPIMAELWKEYWANYGAWEPISGPRAFESFLKTRSLRVNQLFPTEVPLDNHA